MTSGSILVAACESQASSGRNQDSTAMRAVSLNVCITVPAGTRAFGARVLSWYINYQL